MKCKFIYSGILRREVDKTQREQTTGNLMEYLIGGKR